MMSLGRSRVICGCKIEIGVVEEGMKLGIVESGIELGIMEDSALELDLGAVADSIDVGEIGSEDYWVVQKVTE